MNSRQALIGGEKRYQHESCFSCAFFMLCVLYSWDVAQAQDSFYKGKSIPYRGGSLRRRRLRRLHAHIGALSRQNVFHGNPAIVVENVKRAGHLIGANHVYRLAKPDGLTLGHFRGGLSLHQLFGRPGIEFDARKFEFIGAPVTDNRAPVLLPRQAGSRAWKSGRHPRIP